MSETETERDDLLSTALQVLRLVTLELAHCHNPCLCFLLCLCSPRALPHCSHAGLSLKTKMFCLQQKALQGLPLCSELDVCPSLWPSKASLNLVSARGLYQGPQLFLSSSRAHIEPGRPFFWSNKNNMFLVDRGRVHTTLISDCFGCPLVLSSQFTQVTMV